MTAMKRRQEENGKGYMVAVYQPNVSGAVADRRRYVRGGAAIFYGDMEKIRELCDVRYKSIGSPLHGNQDYINRIESGVARAINTTVRVNSYDVHVEMRSELHVLVPYASSQGFVKISPELIEWIKTYTACSDTDFGTQFPEWWEFWKVPSELVKSRVYIGKSLVDCSSRFKRREVNWFNIDNATEFAAAVCHLWQYPCLSYTGEEKAA
jgi:hypothetical protein